MSARRIAAPEHAELLAGPDVQLRVLSPAEDRQLEQAEGPSDHRRTMRLLISARAVRSGR